MKFASFVFIGSIALAQSFVAFAHDDHKHEAAIEAAPHGGTLRDADPFKAEAVLNGDNIKLYVYDKQLKPLKMEKPTLTGKVQFPKQKAQPVSFKKSGDFYEATVKGISKVHRYDLHVDIEAQGKKVVADFGIDNIQ